MDCSKHICLLLLFIVAGAQSQEFKTWEEWSSCTVTCGRGTQERKRECANGRCVQKATRGCQIRRCTDDDGGGSSTVDRQFKNWEQWSRCSKTCGAGIKERKRECANGRCSEKETKTCRIEACDDDESDKWPEWSECSVTCGHGVVTRQRQCPVGNCIQKQTQTCYLKPCPVGLDSNVTYGPWQEWSSCSTTCGRGQKSRIRPCKEMKCHETEVGSCTIKPCPGELAIVTGQWEDWGSCSATCGYGQRKRKRTCTVGVCEQNQTENCKIRDCPGEKLQEYHEWQGWEECSVSCGIGTQKRRRRCVVGLCHEIMTKDCFRKTCPGQKASDMFMPWRPWGECSVTCGNGERRRSRNCKPPANCLQTQTQTCNKRSCTAAPGPTSDPEDRFHSWEDWSECSASCGQGEETRRRRCKVGGCIEVARRTCRIRSCFEEPVTEYDTWGQWSTCSATCGAGEAKRTRSYSDGSNTQEQLRYCHNKRCETEDSDKYGEWREWSGCSVSCDTGIRTRVRFCKVGSCRDTQTKPCKEIECVPLDLDAKYGQWQAWGECSKTCGFGFSYRKRYCKVGVCEQTSSKTCRLKACPTDYTEWEEWGECSVTCGSGISTRKRYCTVGSCDEKQQTTCDMEKCGSGWEDWAEWQGCHKSCGGGFDYRIRRCIEQLPSEKCPGDDHDYKRCNTQSCTKGVWGMWSDWEKCQVTCGTGTTVRIRICEEGKCEGDGKETKPCNTMECVKVHWSAWSEWGECSVTCGKGERSRSRNCIGGRQWDEGCLGSLLMKETCRKPACVRARWSKWSPWRQCSATCGKGQKTRERVCIGGDVNDGGCIGRAAVTRRCTGEPCKKAQWQQWSDWEACSVTCGGGSTSRTKLCSGGNPGDPGCAGDDEQSKPCRTDECPPNGKWTEWAKWTDCSVTCGIGTILRTRTCNGDKEACKGRGQEADVCIKEDCTARWGEWSSWSICSATCDAGLTIRIRKCVGGSPGDKGCEEGGQESKECKERECDETPLKTTETQAKWSPWSDWSACPVSCDSGMQSRSRTCSRFGNCHGESEEARYCHTHACPTEVPKGGRWTNWEKWEDCPVPCGSGIARRTRKCMGGKVGKGGCSGRKTQHRRCKRDDCEWSTWASFGKCSVTCGKGTRRRMRKCADGVMEVTKCLGQWIDVAECVAADSCPFDPNVQCPNIARPRKSDVIATTATPYKFGAELTFVCDVGYEARGESMIVCQSDGRWSGPAPYCAATSCTRNVARVPDGQTCHEECGGDNDCLGSTRKCVCDGWCGKSCFDPDAECEPLSLHENGYIVGSVRTYGYTVTYGCNDGYILVGTPTRTCRSDGRWTGLAAKCQSFSTPGIAGDVGNVFGPAVERVVQGDDANIGAWPWQALILKRHEENLASKTLEAMKAGGSLINNKWILTASHILQKPDETSWQNFMVIALGVTRVPQKNTTLPDYAQLFEPNLVVKHEKFESKNFDYDIALIKVGKRLKIEGGLVVIDEEKRHGQIIFGSYVRPVALPCISACDVDGKDVRENGINVRSFSLEECVRYGRNLKSATKEKIVVTGYGDKSKNTLTSRETEIPDSLQQAALKLLKSDDCIEGVKRIREEYKHARFTRRMLCTGTDEGKDACQGDSGGPLVGHVSDKEGNTCWVQLGIISWGWGCANTDKHNIPYPGYYADMSSLMPWVVKTLEDHP